MHRVTVVVGLLSSSLPARALAAEGTPSPDVQASPPVIPARGFQLGARLGYSVPTGTIAHGSSTHLSDLETGSVSIGFDAGYRLSPAVYLGGTIAWGPGVAPNSQSTCPAKVSCFRHNAQLRADARFYLTPAAARVAWWMALGAGWEVAAFSQTYAGNTITSTFTGPVFADLQFGFESRAGAGAIGPYLGIAVAEFLTEGTNPSATDVSTWIPDPGPHTWITLGLRGAYGL